MTQYDNTNRGAIWKNEDKQDDKHPDFKGSINVNATEYWLSAWKRKDGAAAKSPVLTFRVQPKEAARTSGKSSPPRSVVSADNNGDMNDDIPF